MNSKEGEGYHYFILDLVEKFLFKDHPYRVDAPISATVPVLATFQSDGLSTGIITLEIDNFSQSTGYILSPSHLICDLNWRVDFEFSDGRPSFYLRCDPGSKRNRNSSWFCYARVELILVSQKEGTENLTRNFDEFFHSKSSRWGYQSFATLKQFNDPNQGYIKSGKIILQAHIRAATANSAISNLPASQDPVNPNTSNTCKPFTLTVTSRAGQENAYQVSSQLNELRKAKVLCDVNILVNDAVFPCHRVVLASACHYFKAMFTHNFVELKRKDVTLQNIEPKIFELILDFMYTGKICIDHENVYHLLVGSDFLGLKFIERLCIAYLKHHVPNDNIAQLCLFVVRRGDDQLIKSLLQPHVKNNFDSLSYDLHSLPSNVLVQILTPDCVKSNTEAVLSFLLEWVKVNKETQFVLNLLKSVDHLSLDGNTLFKIMTTITEITVENKECDNAKSMKTITEITVENKKCDKAKSMTLRKRKRIF